MSQFKPFFGKVIGDYHKQERSCALNPFPNPTLTVTLTLNLNLNLTLTLTRTLKLTLTLTLIGLLAEASHPVL